MSMTGAYVEAANGSAICSFCAFVDHQYWCYILISKHDPKSNLQNICNNDPLGNAGHFNFH